MCGRRTKQETMKRFTDARAAVCSAIEKHLHNEHFDERKIEPKKKDKWSSNRLGTSG